MAKRRIKNTLATQQSVDQAIKSICDIMRRGNCAGAMQYVPELTWILFLRILDEHEEREQQESLALGIPFRPSLEEPYRWRDWAAPGGLKRRELQEGAMGSFFAFVNGCPEANGRLSGLLPHLKELKNRPDAAPRQKVISEVMSGVERVRIDTERNFLDVLDKVHQISVETVDPTHFFTLSQIYEGMLLKMGEKRNDGGQFFTPRQVIKAMVQVVRPEVGETVYDPGCGTGGFLAQSYEYMREHLGAQATGEQLELLKQRTFWGREKENLIYPIALANLILHGIDKPSVWHGNTLTGQETYGGLFDSAPTLFDVVLTNPPFGGKEGKEAQTSFPYKTRSTQVLFLQHVLSSLRPGGRCGIVVDDGLIFRTDQDAFVKTKRKLLDECDLWCILALPQGVFSSAGATVRTDLLFFRKGGPTRTIWYYDLGGLNVTKKNPLTLKRLENFFHLLPNRANSELSWTIDIEDRKRRAADEARPHHDLATRKKQEAAQWKDSLAAMKKAKPRDEAAITEAEAKVRALSPEARDADAKGKEIEDAVYDLKAVNPHKKPVIDIRTPEELLTIIAAKGREISEALAVLMTRQVL